MLHFTPIAPNTPTLQIKPMAPWHAKDMLDPDSPGGPAWGGLFDVEALGMSQDNPTSSQPGCDYWPSRAQSIAWWEKQPANSKLSNINKYTYGTPQHFQWIIGTEYSHQDAMGWQYAACPPPPPTGGGGSATPTTVKTIGSISLYGNTVKVNSNGTATVCVSAGTCQVLKTTVINDPGGVKQYMVNGISGNQSASIATGPNGNMNSASFTNAKTKYQFTHSGLSATSLAAISANLNGTPAPTGSGTANLQSNAQFNGAGKSQVNNINGTAVKASKNVNVTGVA
jgi:hypothetical protein